METLKPDQFKEVCPDGLDVIVKCGTVGAARYKKLKIIKFNHRNFNPIFTFIFKLFFHSGMEQFAKILGSDENLINDAKLSRDVKDFYSILNESVVRASYPCIGIIFGKKCVPEQSMWLQNHFSRIAGNYLRPPSLRHLAQQ